MIYGIERSINPSSTGEIIPSSPPETKLEKFVQLNKAVAWALQPVAINRERNIYRMPKMWRPPNFLIRGDWIKQRQEKKPNARFTLEDSTAAFIRKDGIKTPLEMWR